MEGRFQGGTSDSPLLESSIELLNHLGQALKGVFFDAAFSSKQRRAIDTAGIILKHNELVRLIAQKDERLNEWDFGELDGITYPELVSKYPDLVKDFTTGTAKFPGHDYGGEEIEDLEARFKSFLTSLAKERYDNVLIVSHGAFLSCVLKCFDGFDHEDLDLGELRNGSLSVIDFGINHFEIKTWNQILD
jgi:probable phosphoglycerate mutase